MARLMQLPNGTFIDPISVKIVRTYNDRNQFVVEVFCRDVPRPEWWTFDTKQEAIDSKLEIVAAVNKAYDVFREQKEKEQHLKQQKLSAIERGMY